MTDRFGVLLDEDDFFWYKHRLDQELRHLHEHRNEPVKYPCLVGSAWKLDHEVKGGKVYEHQFFYDREIDEVVRARALAGGSSGNLIVMEAHGG